MISKQESFAANNGFEVISLTDHTIAVYKTHDEATEAINRLIDQGFIVKNLSVIGQNYATEEHAVGFINAGDRMMAWGKLGAFWGGLWGLMFGSAMMFIPGIGYLMLAGWLVSLLEGAVVGGGIGAIGGALSSIGIPQNSIVNYEAEIKAGSFLVFAHGTPEEVEHAKKILGTTMTTSLDSYSTNPISNR